MLAWLFGILVGRLCWHRWAVHSENKGIVTDSFGGYHQGIVVILKCEKCGNMKQEFFYP